MKTKLINAAIVMVLFAMVTGTAFATPGPRSVPDGGTTVIMLGFVLSGLAGLRRFLRR